LKGFLVLIFLILIFRIQISFLNFLNFIDKPIREVNVKVINQYKKKNYYVLKLKNNEITFYTISRDNLKNLLNENISLKIFTQKISFLGYLTKFYAISFDLKLQEANFLENFIESQHKEKKFQNLFKALFLAQAIDYETRKELSALGISHLFALSGFHLGIISGSLFFILGFFYKKFQKLFPYRNRYFDLGVVILGIEFLYLYITSFPPSLIRAYIMEWVLFLYAIYLRNVFDLKILIVTILVSFLVFFSDIFYLGFLLSVLGIFYIMLFFKYYEFNFLNSLFLSVFLFLMMFVYSHTFFGEFNYYQFLSPFVSLGFGVFYPLEVLLHLLGAGGAFDGLISEFLKLGDNFFIYKLPLFVGVLFFLLSLVAYYKKWAFYGINLLAILILGGVFL